MAQTPSLKKLNRHSYEQIAFVTWLRNENRLAFFDEKYVFIEDSLRWHQTQTDRDFYIIWYGKQMAGTLAVQHLKDCEFLQNLCINETFRGKGLAKWAVTKLMKPGRFIIAQVKPSNKHVIKMYEELGFWRVK